MERFSLGLLSVHCSLDLKHTEKLLLKRLRSRDTVIKMEIIKEETEDFRIEAVFSLKQEETEEQTG